MSGDWPTLLNQTLSHLKQDRTPRVALMGVGHELRGDDAAGVRIARALKPLFDQRETIRIIDGGHAPENQTGALRRFAPDFVLLLDAAEMAEPAGTVRWLAWPETGGLDAFTHITPLNMITQYLRHELACEVGLIGIQPAHLDIGAGLSPAVQASVETIIQTLTVMLMDFQIVA
ncbi:MAG: hydrogenase 3 maturation endopeptidase HyCI [Anaerolineae bacterium]|nr:hydrogenase 3 maturation endopeptidase HyCI [Anaerolineae bacterium]